MPLFSGEDRRRYFVCRLSAARLLSFIFIYLLLTPSFYKAHAQRRQIGDAKTILLRGKDFEKAEKMMTDLLKDTNNLQNKRIYDVWLQAVEKQYGQLNDKMYVKQKVDTAKLFTLTQRIFTVGERLDSLDMLPDKKGKVSPEYRKDNAQRLTSYRPNLFFGGAYYVRKQNFRNAYDFFEMYLDCDNQPLFEGYDFLSDDPRMGEAAYWATYCGYRMDDPMLCLRYADIARRDTSKLEYTLHYICESWRKLGNDSLYQQSLWEGFRLNPKSLYFFPRLMDGYTSRGNYLEADKVVDEALATDSLHELFLYAKSNVMLNLQRFADCLRYSERLLERNHEAADAYYNAGIACLNIAQRIDSRKYKKQIKRMYQRALPYMEAYRRMEPDQKDKWGPALYRIYFNLNMGKQFDEIDKLLKR